MLGYHLKLKQRFSILCSKLPLYLFPNNSINVQLLFVTLIPQEKQLSCYLLHSHTSHTTKNATRQVWITCCESNKEETINKLKIDTYHDEMKLLSSTH